MNVASYYRVEWNGGGMEDVVEGNEEQIEIVDHNVTNLYPFILAAVGDTATNYDLNTEYNLIKRRPDVVKLYNTPILIGREKRTKMIEEVGAMKFGYK